MFCRLMTDHDPTTRIDVAQAAVDALLADLFTPYTYWRREDSGQRMLLSSGLQLSIERSRAGDRETFDRILSSRDRSVAIRISPCIHFRCRMPVTSTSQETGIALASKNSNGVGVSDDRPSFCAVGAVGYETGLEGHSRWAR